MDYKLINKFGKSFITVPRLEELGLKNCFTTIDMDLGTNTNRSTEDIKENFNTIYKFLDVEPESLYYGIQVHSNHLELINNESRPLKDDIALFFPDTDGLITSKENIALNTRFADCIPIIIFDPKNMIQANIHSGWKGTLESIGIRGLEIMFNKCKSKAEDLLVVLGPAIGKEDFEVDIDVMEKFKEEFTFHDQIIKQKNQGKYLIDLKGIVVKQFLAEGIREENIIDIDLSTFSTPYLHSFRRDKERFGLMGCVTII